MHECRNDSDLTEIVRYFMFSFIRLLSHCIKGGKLRLAFCKVAGIIITLTKVSYVLVCIIYIIIAQQLSNGTRTTNHSLIVDYCYITTFNTQMIDSF